MSTYQISTESLTNGELVALGAIEITSIPHISIIDERQGAISDVVEKYKTEMVALLNEVYQSYKTVSYSNGYSKDISFELLWTTHEVKNQPYNAEIKPFIIVRSIDNDRSVLTTTITSLLDLITSTLSLQKYEHRVVEGNDLKKTVASINDASIKAIVKEEKVSRNFTRDDEPSWSNRFFFNYNSCW